MSKTVRLVVLAIVAVCLVSPAAAQSTRQKAKAAPRSPEALYQQCRQEAFRKFGWHNGSQVVLYTTFMIEQTDFCVRNGGHF